MNLLTNAAKYTDPEGHIGVTLQQEGEQAVLRVRDTGVGIAPEVLPRIFDLFTQAERSLDRSQGGLGIGLALVQRLVEIHGGTVAASSILGEGSEFVVRLPVVSPPQPVPSLSATEKAQPTGPSLRVLVVDDNVDTVTTLALLVQESGHEVRTAYDGLAVLEAALDYRPNVVLLDIGLPGLNGFAAPVSPEHRVHYVVEAPPVFFGHSPLQIAATILFPAAIAALVYALMAVSTARDDLGAWPPVEEPVIGPPVTAESAQPPAQ